MNIVLVGHRGVGKTSLLEKIKNLNIKECIDLDSYIEKKERKTILKIFEENGEDFFRDLERKYFKEILKEKNNLVLSVGAGLRFEKLKEARVLWIRRESDKKGRVFLDRPSLSKKDPLQEFLSLFDERENFYKTISDEVHTLKEGGYELNKFLLDSIKGRCQEIPGTITYTNELYKSWLESLKLKEVEIKDEFSTKHNHLFSYRNKENNNFKKPQRIDWALELGEPKVEADILSWHGNVFPKIKTNKILKYSPLINSFKDLKKSYEWYLKDPNKRILLPRSKDGRWNWFRLFMKGKMPLNFYKIYEGSALDQPFLNDWYDHPINVDSFAAVLGNNVSLSYSPSFHYDYLRDKGIPFYAINVNREEWGDAISFLQEIGLRFAAVTSPFKSNAYDLSAIKSKVAKKYQAVNTLVFGKEIRGDFTDVQALDHIFSKNIYEAKTAIYGGGGLLKMLGDIFKNNMMFSARTSLPREVISLPEGLNEDFEQVIWAAGAGDYKFPELKGLKRIIDLSYLENSDGLRYAKKHNLEYISGKKMFEAQASLQKNIWGELL